MHEAQTPDDGAYIQNLNSIDLPQSSAGATNPFHSILAGENKAKKQFLLPPAFAEEAPPNQTMNSSPEEEVVEDIDYSVEVIIDSQFNQLPQLDEETNLEENPLEDEWVAEPNAEQQAIINHEFQQLLELNEELRAANNKLYEQVEELNAALSDSEAALGRQKRHSTIAESMLKQQTQELNAAQAQIQSLFEQIENTVQKVQRQESLASSYKAQLELSQQRLAQLERECSSIQTKYSEKSHLLSQSENVCRELRTRLKRQQRQTLQFKAALEKSLETSIPGYDHLDDGSSFPDITKNNSQLTQSLSSIQPIKPWSAPPESYKTQNDLWEEIVTTEASTNGENPIEEESSTWEFSANNDIETNKDVPETQTEDSEKDEELAAQEVVSPSDSSELEEKLDSVIQTFFASQTESELPNPHQKQDAETSETIISAWEPMVEPSQTNNDDNIDTSQSSDCEDEQMTTFNSSMNENNTYELEDYWEEVSDYPAFDVSENTSSFETLRDTDSHSNSPSPLIYPKRPSKGRKSFASVELPKFNQKKDEDKS
ncbi:MAG: hypothetical protein AAF915_19825 [Cyanobacteria bacterium P01_D01_bin.50]